MRGTFSNTSTCSSSPVSQEMSVSQPIGFFSLKQEVKSFVKEEMEQPEAAVSLTTTKQDVQTKPWWFEQKTSTSCYKLNSLWFRPRKSEEWQTNHGPPQHRPCLQTHESKYRHKIKVTEMTWTGAVSSQEIFNCATFFYCCSDDVANPDFLFCPHQHVTRCCINVVAVAELRC